MAKGTKGKLVQVIGTVVDVEFPAEELPEVYDAVEVEAGDGNKLLVEVQQHLGNNWVRCLAMDTTDGLRLGAECIDTGAPIAVPVGRASLGRLFNVLGQPLDDLGEVKADEHWPIMVKEYHTPAGTLRVKVRQTDDWRWGDHVPFLDDYIVPRSRKFLVTGSKDLDGLLAGSGAKLQAMAEEQGPDTYEPRTARGKKVIRALRRALE